MEEEDENEILLKTEMELHEAARVGDLGLVESLIDQGVNVNAMNEKDRTALHLASGQGHVEIVKTLLDADARVDAEDKFGMNALLWAAWFGKQEALHALIVGGARVKCENKQGLSLLHCASLRGHLNVVKYVVEQLMQDEPMNPDKILTLDDKEEKFPSPPILRRRMPSGKKRGAWRGLDASEKLERSLLNTPSPESQGGRTPMHLAAEHGRTGVVEYLMNTGADKMAYSRVGLTCLHFAAKGGHQSVVNLLIKSGVEIDARDNDGKTPLHCAAEEGHAHTVETLIQSGADINAETYLVFIKDDPDRNDEKEMSPLHFAAMNGHTAVVKVLLMHGCDMDASNHQNNTALHIAATSNRPEVVHQLVNAGCDVDVVNARNQTALHVATENALTNVVETLLIGGINVHIKDKSGRTALQMAARAEHITITDMIIKADKFFMKKQMKNEEFRRGQEKIQFRKDQCEEATQMRPVIWKLGTRQLRKDEWKKLAFVWGFTDAHIKAIEHQFTGEKSWKEHSYRLLLIWLHGCDENPVKGLYEGLVGIGRKDLADQIRRRINARADGNGGRCSVS
ncbi:ankyrin repeat and death domain-containing protein 1A-like isoform X2 [Ptychodera flava]|uniref:ankyrin repeat and death domain-containing protein 1A-like isoform X2 n=1 Tax=Ptychodera flava TaxID=63121 RepID=UPI003969FFE6